MKKVFLTKDGREFTIRKPTADNAEEIINYSKLLFASTDQVLTTLDEYTITLENEKKWIEQLNDNPNSLLQKCLIVLLVFFSLYQTQKIKIPTLGNSE